MNPPACSVDPAVLELRADAEHAFRSAVAEVQPSRLVPSAVRRDGGRIEVLGVELPILPGRRLVAALGKAGPTLADAWLEALPGWATAVFVLTPHGVPMPPRVAATAVLRRGAHPYPDANGEAAAAELLRLAAGLGPDDLLLVLLSGGASALLAAPAKGLKLEDVRATTEILLRAGAPITAVNTVRRQLLAAAGGGLARAAFPARVISLVLSDVLGDPLPDIASGPTVPSPTTAADAVAVLERYGVAHGIPMAVSRFLAEGRPAPGDTAWVDRATTRVLGNNWTAVAAAAAALERRGYEVASVGTPMVGEAAARGRQLGQIAAAMRPGARAALVVGGETTVAVRGRGRGGRNHELALAAALTLRGGQHCCALLAAGTDGIDGMTDAAGAIVDPTTCRRIADAGLDADQALSHNDSGTALAAAGDAIVTGPTGTNVCDLTLVLASGP